MAKHSNPSKSPRPTVTVMIQILNISQSARLWPVGPSGRTSLLRVAEQFAQIPVYGEWFPGLLLYDGNDWVAAHLLVTHVAAGTPYQTRSDALEAGDVLVARATLAGTYHEFDLRELRYWPARWTGPTLALTEPLADLAAGSDDPSVPALPPGWSASETAAWWDGGSSWLAQSTTNLASIIIDVLKLDAPQSERLAADLEKIRQNPHRGLAVVDHVWLYPDGLMVQGVQNPRCLSDALACGDVDGESLIRAVYDVALAIDHLAAIGASAHRNIKPDNIAWSPAYSCALQACYPDEVELGGPQAAVGFLAPERVCGEPVSSLSDQFALAMTYMVGRTGRNPLIPNESSVLAGLRPIPLQGLYPAEAAVLRRALDPDPLRRWPDARSFALALANAQGMPRSQLHPEIPDLRVPAESVP